MGLFDAIGAAGSGMVLARKWMDAVGDNIANMNDATRTSQGAFQQRYVVATAKDYGADHSDQSGGVDTSAALGSAQGRLVYEPTNALADKDGYVRYPDIDLSTQMGQLIISQRAYQANAAVVDRARASYEAGLEIGKK